jgi:hypothetical protein
MKLFRIVLLVTLLLAASVSFAQTKPGDFVAAIPFAFVAAGRTLPPGHYVVNNLDDHLWIHDPQNHSFFVLVHSAQRPAHDNTSKMVFHSYGDVYFLSEVWVGGNSIGRVLFPSRAEKKLLESGNERQIAVVRIEP